DFVTLLPRRETARHAEARARVLQAGPDCLGVGGWLSHGRSGRSGGEPEDPQPERARASACRAVSLRGRSVTKSSINVFARFLILYFFQARLRVKAIPPCWQ